MSEDLFGDREIPNVFAKPRREWPAPEPAGVFGLTVVGLLAAGLAYLFDMPFPTGPAFVALCVATRAARNRRRLQQTLRTVAAAVFFTYGPVTIVTAFAPAVRLVFFSVLVGSALALYEWLLGKK